MQIFSRNKYLYYTFYLFYCQSRISFLCNLSRNICEILRFFRRKFQKSVLFFSFITKSPGKWGFLLKNVCKKLENGEQKGAPYKRNAFVLTRDSIHIFQHLSNTFFRYFWASRNVQNALRLSFDTFIFYSWYIQKTFIRSSCQIHFSPLYFKMSKMLQKYFIDT